MLHRAQQRVGGDRLGQGGRCTQQPGGLQETTAEGPGDRGPIPDAPRPAPSPCPPAPRPAEGERRLSLDRFVPLRAEIAARIEEVGFGGQFDAMEDLDEVRAALGISDTLVRLSVGVEAADDLINDLAAALG